MQIQIGKHKRTVEVEAYLCRDDTRWHVYPSDNGKRFIEAVVCGEVCRFSDEHGFWFRSPIQGSAVRRASDDELAARGALIPDQLRSLLEKPKTNLWPIGVDAAVFERRDDAPDHWTGFCRSCGADTVDDECVEGCC